MSDDIEVVAFPPYDHEPLFTCKKSELEKQLIRSLQSNEVDIGDEIKVYALHSTITIGVNINETKV